MWAPDLDHGVHPALPPPDPEHPVESPGHHEAVGHRVEAGCVHVAGVAQSGHPAPPAVCHWSDVRMEPPDIMIGQHSPAFQIRAEPSPTAANMKPSGWKLKHLLEKDLDNLKSNLIS